MPLLYRTVIVLTLLIGTCPRAANAQMTFSDQTAAAGLLHPHWDGVAPISALREVYRLTAGAAAGDYDNDGDVDLYVTRLGQPNALYANQNDGTFVDVAAAAGVALAAYCSGCFWADVNNDRHLDLYITTLDPTRRNYLYINNGDGTFDEDAVARGIAIPEAPSSIHLHTGAAFADYDNDGWLDACVTEWSLAGQSSLLRNTGDGYFENVTTAANLFIQNTWGFAPAFADMNNDGHPDLLIAADFATSRMFLNNGDGTFTDVTAAHHVGTDENGMGSAIGDIDNDGDLDWFVTSIFDSEDTCGQYNCNWGATGNRLYLNDGDGVFTDATDAWGVRNGGWGWGAVLFDGDNDGDLDLGMTNGVVFPWGGIEDQFNADRNCLWENQTAGSPGDPVIPLPNIAMQSNFADQRSGKGLLVFDYDNDGDVDCFLANNLDPPVLYRNDSPAAAVNNWLQLTLRGTRSNAQAIGAHIEITPRRGGPTLTRVVSANSNYMSQSDARIHVGLGPVEALTPSSHTHAGLLARLQVHWPTTSRTTTLTNFHPNRHLVLTEPPAATIR